MRPPVCDVCEADAGEGGGLVRAASTPADLEWRERAERERLVGHPPDTGWFCAQHLAPARALAADASLSQVLAALRRGETAPTPAASASGEGAASRGLSALWGELRDVLPALVTHVGMDASSLTKNTHRQWFPMDGVMEPNCPFSDTTVYEAVQGDLRVTLTLDAAWWNPEEMARSSLSLDVRGAGESDFSVRAWSPASDAPDAVEDVRIDGTLADVVKRVLGVDT